ncbi:SDR family oxidoreductase [Flavobacteriaceae bacterium]|nr:SDR family oxidoreductase [Flavobacteriaceae bacterium]
MNNIYNIFSVEKKRVLITGAANGNGAFFAKGFARAGSDLFLVDIDKQGLERTASNIRNETGRSVRKYLLDLSDSEAIDKFFSIKENTNFDVVINNAGITIGNSISNYSDLDWELTHKINLTAPYKIIKAVIGGMCERKSGSIINITSLAAELGFPGNPAYSSSKGGLKQLTKSVANDVSNFGVRINSVGPGYFKTNMTKKSWNDKELRSARSSRIIMDRWGESEDLIGVLIFLASDSSSYITGQDFYVDGGWLAKGL